MASPQPAALEVQVQSECRHLAALRVRVQGSKKKCKCKECKKIGKSDHGDVHIAPPTTTYVTTHQLFHDTQCDGEIRKDVTEYGNDVSVV